MKSIFGNIHNQLVDLVAKDTPTQTIFSKYPQFSKTQLTQKLYRIRKAMPKIVKNQKSPKNRKHTPIKHNSTKASNADVKHGLTFSSDVEDSSSDEMEEDDRVSMAYKFKECGLVYWHESTTCLRVMIPKSAHWVISFEISDQDEIVLKQFRNLPPEAVISEDFHRVS
ncbi:hypothetical protein BC833DRAFT_652304 [Globomyces pollinis-pini]|nr:hypothetical protein BC833DRAFT_652304 [Globomyces pollinis-pini]